MRLFTLSSIDRGLVQASDGRSETELYPDLGKHGIETVIHACYNLIMPRQARIVIPGVPHHVTQRGNNRQTVFFNDDDRQNYLRVLKESTKRHGLFLIAYCLMTNHVHLVITPQEESGLSKGIGRAHLIYAQHVQRARAMTGHFWQGRFKSCPLDPVHADTAIAYVELNPVRAGMCANAEDYPWSSAAYHCGSGLDTTGFICDGAGWDAMSPTEWRAKLRALSETDGEFESIRNHTTRGQPFGERNFRRRAALREQDEDLR
jgi:putative transposase